MAENTQGITLEVAKQNLEMWLAAERAVTTGQSYKIGSRELTRVSAKEIRESIRYWQGYISRLETGRKRGAMTMRIIPRDI
ncbi:MAG: DUF6148 family protein [Fusobacteriaceae bacterium]